MIKFIITIATAFVLVTACSSQDALGIDYAVASANARRGQIQLPTAVTIAQLGQQRRIVGNTVDLGAFATGLPETPEGIFAELAKQDVYVLFNLIRDVYGGYYHFGGDEIFIPLRDYMIATLATQAWWDYQAFSNLLATGLGEVIGDNHFVIGGTALSPGFTFFSSHVPFGRNSEGFFHIYSGRQVVEVVGQDIDQTFRLQLDADGHLFYGGVVYFPGVKDHYDFTVILDNGDAIVDSLTPTTTAYLPFQLSSLTFYDAVPVVTARSMSFVDGASNLDGLYRQDAINFLAYATQLATEPVVIVDIRSNVGGNIFTPTMWLYRLLGEIVPPISMGIPRRTRINLPDIWLEEWYISGEDIERYITADAAQHIENDTLLIVLTDRHVFSAGEVFAGQLLNIEHTLIIGQNTGGALLTNTFGFPMYLPYSNVAFSFGHGQFIFPEGVFEEGLGFAPDIWVDGDALVAALAMLANR